MASSLFPDPLQLWRDALTKLEGEANSLAMGSAKSQEVMRSMHQLSSASQSMQQMVDKAIALYLRRANLPSRQDVKELSASLQRIEEKLDRLLPQEVPAELPRPARTRRPSSAAAAQPPTAAPATPKTAAPATPKRRASGRAGG